MAEKLALSVDCKVGSNTKKQGRRCGQTVSGFSTYLTKTDLDCLKADVHSSIKIDTIAERCFMLKLHCPKEPTVKHIVATMVDCGLEATSAKDKFNAVQDLKAKLRAKVKPLRGTGEMTNEDHLANYPEDPRDLPESIWRRALSTCEVAVDLMVSWKPELRCGGACLHSLCHNIYIAYIYICVILFVRVLPFCTSSCQVPICRDELKQIACIRSAYSDEEPCRAHHDKGVGSLDFGCRKTHKSVRNEPNQVAATGFGLSADQVMAAAVMLNKVLQGQSMTGADVGLSGLQVFQNSRKNKALANTAQEPQTARKPLALEDKHDSPAQMDTKDAPETSKEQCKQSELFDLPVLESPGNNVKTPEEHMANVSNAFKARENAKETSPGAKVKPQGKAKAKAAAKGKAKAAPTPKGKAKPSPKGKAQASNKKQTGASPVKKAHLKVPQPGSGTYFHKNGKVHRSDKGLCWRVFVHKSDRCDKKVPFHGDEAASFQKALRLIEAGA